MYRDGEEIVEPGPVKVDKTRTSSEGLKTWGAFGPILGLVLVDAAQSKLAWSHWEQGPDGHIAVFRYSVPKDRSHYEVRYCCVASSYGLESELVPADECLSRRNLRRSKARRHRPAYPRSGVER